eukprot:1156440-Pelagomonas_calceolata.AAC.4
MYDVCRHPTACPESGCCSTHLGDPKHSRVQGGEEGNAATGEGGAVAHAAAAAATEMACAGLCISEAPQPSIKQSSARYSMQPKRMALYARLVLAANEMEIPEAPTLSIKSPQLCPACSRWGLTC